MIIMRILIILSYSNNNNTSRLRHEVQPGEREPLAGAAARVPEAPLLGLKQIKHKQQ